MGGKPYLLPVKIRILLNTHNRTEVEGSFVKTLAKVCNKHDHQDTSVNLPEQSLVGGSIDLDGRACSPGYRLLISSLYMLLGSFVECGLLEVTDICGCLHDFSFGVRHVELLTVFLSVTDCRFEGSADARELEGAV